MQQGDRELPAVPPRPVPVIRPVGLSRPGQLSSVGATTVAAIRPEMLVVAQTLDTGTRRLGRGHTLGRPMVLPMNSGDLPTSRGSKPPENAGRPARRPRPGMETPSTMLRLAAPLRLTGSGGSRRLPSCSRGGSLSECNPQPGGSFELLLLGGQCLLLAVRSVPPRLVTVVRLDSGRCSRRRDPRWRRRGAGPSHRWSATGPTPPPSPAA